MAIYMSQTSVSVAAPLNQAMPIHNMRQGQSNGFQIVNGIKEIGSRRRWGRHTSNIPNVIVPQQKKDSITEIKKEDFYYAEHSQRIYLENSKRALLDAEILLSDSNKFGVVLEIAKAARDYQRANREEACFRQPILQAISDKIKERGKAGSSDAYLEDLVDYSVFVESEDDVDEYKQLKELGATEWSERAEWDGLEGLEDEQDSSADEGMKLKKKEIVWLPIHDNTKSYNLASRVKL